MFCVICVQKILLIQPHSLRNVRSRNRFTEKEIRNGISCAVDMMMLKVHAFGPENVKVGNGKTVDK